MGKKSQKRFIWIKLSDDFLFKDLKIKKLRKLAGGDTFTIIYLKLMLISKNNNGVIEYEGIEKTIEEEIALKIDEDADNVLVTINYLKNVGLLELRNDLSVFLPQVETLIGSESESAERTRRYRERLKQKNLEKQGVLLFLPEQSKEQTSQCDTNVTIGNKNVTLEKEKEEEEDKKTLTYDTLFNYINKIMEQPMENSDLFQELKRLNFYISDISFFNNDILPKESKEYFMVVIYAINEIINGKNGEKIYKLTEEDIKTIFLKCKEKMEIADENGDYIRFLNYFIKSLINKIK